MLQDCSSCLSAFDRGVLRTVDDSEILLSRRLWIPPLSKVTVSSAKADVIAGCRYAVSRKLLTSRLGSKFLSKLSLARAS